MRGIRGEVGERVGHATVTDSKPLRRREVQTRTEGPAELAVDRVTITLPLPPPELHAHAKGHWRAKAEPTKACRAQARELVESHCPRPFRWESARISMRFFWPTNQRRDTLNAAQSCKAYVDGLVDAGLVTDDAWQVLDIGGLSSAMDRENPRVEIVVERYAAGVTVT